MVRSSEVQNFLDTTQAAFDASGASDAARRVADRIFAATATGGAAALPSPAQQPACTYLDAALEGARSAGGPIAALADALAVLSVQLAWSQRPSGPEDETAFKDRHANAVVVGINGLETRSDLRIGISLMAPATRYPDHRHPPEEIYTVLSPGEWKQGVAGPWRSPGIGGFVHNTPNIVHAMRSTDMPLLAVWCLWIGDTA